MEKKKEIKKVEKNEKKGLCPVSIIIGLIAIVSLILSLYVMSVKQDKIGEGKDVSYKIYVGLTDNDKNYQTIDKNAAKEIMKMVCLQKGFAYTIYEAEGAHNDKDNVLHTEKTLILEMDHITEEDLKGVMKDIGVRLNIQSMMIVENPIKVFYYYPTK